ncbi:hypothetical protein Q8A67_001227 [Cirrhinus molitorella]|uniref:NAD(P)(+)--arginine ADP-ribosyltransferase n=1 Tax=Cirrhinus molitorella TaxID=172907 RepID=A0AA88TYI7_9TELE|nr:hypothetical protein Q8A67_001227 [Cirrhinus molitorella]
MLLIIEAFLLISAALGQDHRAAGEEQIYQLDMALNSVDDLYYGCKEKMAKLVKTEFLEKELNNSDDFRNAWKKAALGQQEILDMALKSVDDQYDGCTEKMANLVATKYLQEELIKSNNFRDAWHEAALGQQEILDMALNSVDDQYDGCTETMANLVATKYLQEELIKSNNFRDAWREEPQNPYVTAVSGQQPQANSVKPEMGGAKE